MCQMSTKHNNEEVAREAILGPRNLAQHNVAKSLALPQMRGGKSTKLSLHHLLLIGRPTVSQPHRL